MPLLSQAQIRDIALKTPSKMVFLIIDGLGGLPLPATGRTELETAQTPNLDALASRSICGLSEPVGPGITPGSAPAHLALFGYHPVECNIGRGVLEAVGIDFDLRAEDVAARGNFCTVDSNGLIVDRRAGRLPTEANADLCRKLDNMEIEGARALVAPVKEHRFVAVFRGEGLGGDLADSDPQHAGLPPREVVALSSESARTAEIANQFVARARQLLASSSPANMVLLRGFSQHPRLPTLPEVYRLSPAAIAAYPMYRGLARLLGMKVLPTGSTVTEQFSALAQHYAEHDFFFLHIKQADLAGEDGNFEAKVRAIEEVDARLPRLTTLEPDVLVVTGDHSTPALLKGHSWHPVPFLLHSNWCRPDGVRAFSESACASGALGTFPALYTMPLALAHALKLAKFGA